MQTIYRNPDILVYTIEDLNRPHSDLNVDVEVRDESGRWSATFFTLENLVALFEKNARTGECSGGAYFWAADMIVVREISATVVIETVRDLRKAGHFMYVFDRLDE